jgi:hypothetical protein
MAEPDQQVTLKRVFVWILILIVAIWIVYALTGGTSTPKASGEENPPAQQ